MHVCGENISKYIEIVKKLGPKQTTYYTIFAFILIWCNYLASNYHILFLKNYSKMFLLFISSGKKKVSCISKIT